MPGFSLFCDTLLPEDGGFSINGLGICQPRAGRHRIIPALGATRKFISLIFNHDAVKARLDGVDVELPDSCLAIWEPSHSADYGESGGRRWRLSWLQIFGPEAEELVKRSGVPLNKPLRVQDAAAVDGRLKEIADELRSRKRPSVPLVVNATEGLLLRAARAAEHPEETRIQIDSRLLKIKRQLETNSTSPTSLKSLAEKACMSSGHLCRAFKEAFGAPPLDYLMHLRLDNAAGLLADRSVSIAEAGEASGFKGLANFSKTFKRRYGVSPLEYRRRLL